MSSDHVVIFIFLNFLSLIASLAGLVALLLGIDLQLIGGWFLLLGAEVIFWFMLEREIKNTRAFGLLSSFLLIVIISFVLIGDLELISSRIDVLFLVIYLPFRTIYLGVPHEELTFAILFSSVVTIFSGIIIIFTNDFGLIYYSAIALFIAGEFLYFWKKENDEFYHRIFGTLSSGIIFLLLLLVFIPIENTPEFRLDLFIILIYIPFRIFESSLPKTAIKGRTVAFQLSYGLLGLGLILLATVMEALLALEYFSLPIPSYTEKTWVLLEFTFDLLQTTPIWSLGGFLFITFHSLDISSLLLGGLGIFIISEIIFFFKLGTSIISKEREITKNLMYFNLHAILWYFDLLVALSGAYIAFFILGEYQNFLETSNFLTVLFLVLVAYLFFKLIMNCLTTTYWGPITLAFLAQAGLLTSIAVTYLFTETIVVESMRIEPYVIGIAVGILAIFCLLVATYTISERFKSLLLYLWVAWTTINLGVSIFGLFQQNNDLILVGVPLTILTMVITVISSREKLWGVSKGPKKAPPLPPITEAPPPPKTTESPIPPPTSPPPPPSVSWGPTPPSKPEVTPSPPPAETQVKEKKKGSDKLKKMLLDELDKY